MTAPTPDTWVIANEPLNYLRHCLSAFLPGSTLPVFMAAQPFDGDLTGVTPDELEILIDEGRRQLDWQWAQLERLRTRASTLLTVSLAEVALLAGGARSSWHSHWFVAVAWTASLLVALLGMAGTAAVLTGKALIGAIELSAFAAALHGDDALKLLAITYARSVPLGLPTLNTFMTIIRDAVLLLVTGAVTFGIVWPWR